MKTLIWLVCSVFGVILYGWGLLWALAAARDGVVSVLHVAATLLGLAMIGIAARLDKEDAHEQQDDDVARKARD
ncbi:hypothetical protein [Bifidobacterium porcinum]|uniref:hypothetical protein n=1 Tax=Bifidobacterium porcinum TaxID=212365 RepID=UPI0039965D96